MPDQVSPTSASEAFGLFLADEYAGSVELPIQVRRVQGLIREVCQRPLAQLRALDAERFLERRARRRLLAPTTYRHVRGLLVAFATWAIARGYLERNPFVDLARKPAWWKAPTVMGAIEQRELIDQFAQRSPRLAVLVRFMLATGLSADEALGMRWENVAANDESVQLEPPPRALPKARRIVLAAAARRVIAEQRELARSEFVFPAADGTRWKRKTVLGLFRENARLCGFAWILSDLRAAHVVEAIATGEDMRSIASRIGISASACSYRFGALRGAVLSGTLRYEPLADAPMSAAAALQFLGAL